MHGHGFHRVALPRSHRLRRRFQQAFSSEHHREHKRAVKRATMRDCCRRCVYCGSLLDFSVATLDHVYPRCRGGAHAPGNLVVACGPCNRMKGDLLPYEFFRRFPTAGQNFLAYARAVHRALKREARRAVSLAYAEPMSRAA